MFYLDILVPENYYVNMKLISHYCYCISFITKYQFNLKSILKGGFYDYFTKKSISIYCH